LIKTASSRVHTSTKAADTAKLLLLNQTKSNQSTFCKAP